MSVARAALATQEYFITAASPKLLHRTLLVFQTERCCQIRPLSAHTLCWQTKHSPLTTHLMKPCARRGLTVRERIFNYRLYRARCVVENAFGILAHRFRIFLQPVLLHPSKVTDIVLAAVTLHNFLKQTATNGSSYLGDGEVDVEDVSTWTVVQGNRRGDKSSRGMVNVLPVRGNQRSNAKAMRDELAEYFVNEGNVSWQWQHAHSVSL